MNRTGLIRLGGLAAMVGGVASVALWIWVRGDWLGSPLATPTTHLLIVGAMAAIVSLHALQSPHYGLRGAVASLAAFLGLAMYLVGAGVAYARGDFWLAFRDTTFLVVLGLLVATVGLIALGIVTMNVRVLPWWCGVALIAGNPLIEVFLVIFLGSGWLLGVPWLVVGYAVFRAAKREPERPSRVR